MIYSREQMEHALAYTLDAIRMADQGFARPRYPGHIVPNPDPATGWYSDELCGVYQIMFSLRAAIIELGSRETNGKEGST